MTAKYAWVGLLMIYMAVSLGAAPGEAPADNSANKTPAAAQAVRSQYDQEVERAKKDFEQKFASAKALYSKRLEEILAAETRKGNLDGALGVKSMRDKARDLSAAAILESPAPEASRETILSKRPPDAMILFVTGDGGSLRIDGKEAVPVVSRDKASSLPLRLHEGDVIAYRMDARFDVMSLWLVCLSSNGQFLFETSPQWVSYLPRDNALWWDIKGAKIAPSEEAPDKEEYVDRVKEAAAMTGHRHAQPIRSTLAEDDGKKQRGYLYHVVTKQDLLPKTTPPRPGSTLTNEKK